MRTRQKVSWINRWRCESRDQSKCNDRKTDRIRRVVRSPAIARGGHHEIMWRFCLKCPHIPIQVTGLWKFVLAFQRRFWFWFAYSSVIDNNVFCLLFLIPFESCCFCFVRSKYYFLLFLCIEKMRMLLCREEHCWH